IRALALFRTLGAARVRPLPASGRGAGRREPSVARKSSHRGCALMHVEVVGAGVAGLTAAYELARLGAPRGVRVDLVERRSQAGLGCSRLAGGMIAPWC